MMKTDEEYAAELLDRIGAKRYVAHLMLEVWQGEIARAFHEHRLDVVFQFTQDSEVPIVRIDRG